MLVAEFAVITKLVICPWTPVGLPLVLVAVPPSQRELMSPLEVEVRGQAPKLCWQSVYLAGSVGRLVVNRAFVS